MEQAEEINNQQFYGESEDDPKIKAYLNSGHVWKTDGDHIDVFALSEGYHNGPECSLCGYSTCWHCEPNPKPCPMNI